MTPTIAVAAGGWSIVALLVAVAVVAVVSGYRHLTGEPAERRRFKRVLVGLVIAPGAVFALVAAFVVALGVPAWDTAVLKLAISDDGLPWKIVRVLSALGGITAVLVWLVVALVVMVRARMYRQAVFVAAATLASMAVSGLTKLAFARPRPEVTSHVPGSYSFPSGHTMSSTGFAVALVVVLWPTRWRRPALAAAAVYAIGIGLTRLALGVHYLSDVVAGWALATAVVGVTSLALWSLLEPHAGRPSERKAGDGPPGPHSGETQDTGDETQPATPRRSGDTPGAAPPGADAGAT